MTDPISQFTYWFIPKRITTNNEFMSFPSGHAANSSTIIWITLLPLFIDKLKNKEWLLTMIAFLWIIVVMITRIIVRTHFATDVLVGSTITLSLFFWLRNFYLKKYFVNNEVKSLEA